MSSFNLSKKFKPAKKAWKSFTSLLKSKFKNLSVSKTIKNSKKQFIIALHKIRSLIPHKILDWNRSSRGRRRYHLYHHHRCQPSPMKETSSVKSSSFSSSLSEVEKKERVYYCSTTSTNVVSKGVKIVENKRGETSNNKSIIDEKDGLKLSLLSKFRGIDERADEFIFKFKEDMKLQSEKSFLDYQEMLARSV